MDVSIIIVNYNTSKFLKNCLLSIYEHTKNIEFEVIVSDNGSSDDSLDMIKTYFPQVILIENNKNLGFGTANNRGLEIAKGKYIFYLNSDTVLLNNAIKIFFDYFENNNKDNLIGALGANLLNPNMTIGESYASSCGGNCNSYNDILKDILLYMLRVWFIFFKTLFGYKLKHIKKNHEFTKKIGNVGNILGADLFLKNNEFARFDENFFMYFEETDLQYQMKKNNLSRLLIEGPQIIHYGGASSNNIDYEVLDTAKFSMINLFISRIYFCKKNFNGKLKLLLLKLYTTLIWLNPLIVKKTGKNILKIWKI
ncbi:MAG: glycosyltransferase family 2 protein [Treponema sp.]|nr:glycosyltransferase family 2 protein [Spirochaetales bacterium]MDY6188924.1 glycosyltransferase family 2 protein [Treponema sp.]